MCGRARIAIRYFAFLVSACILLPFDRTLPSSQSRESDRIVFSHKSHLNRATLACVNCHTAAESSEAAEDLLLPREATCLKCHDGEQASSDCAVCHLSPESARSYERTDRTYRFDHRRHLSFGNMAPVLRRAVETGTYLGKPGDMLRHLNGDDQCQACHRGVSESESAGGHLLPQMADCLVCHSRIDLPTSCGYCHTPDVDLTPDSHTPEFADLHSRPLALADRSSCKVCHGIKFTCLGCH